MAGAPSAQGEQVRFRRDVLGDVPVDAAGTTVETWVFRRAPLHDAPAHRVVVLHGLGDAPISWFPALRTGLPDHEIVLPALPGAGRGPLPEGLDHLGFAATARWIRETLRRLQADGVPTTLVGHSMGGWFLARALLADPALAERAPILVNNAGTWYDGVERERRLLSPKTLEDVDELTMHLYARDPDIPVEALQAMLQTMRAPSYQGLLWSTQEADFLRAEEIAALPTGTGLVWGRADRLVPPEAFETMRANLDAPRVITLDDVGHAPHIEAPAACVDALGRLLA